MASQITGISIFAEQVVHANKYRIFGSLWGESIGDLVFPSPAPAKQKSYSSHQVIMWGTMQVIQIHDIIVTVNRRSYKKIQLACNVYIASHHVAVRNQQQIQVPMVGSPDSKVDGVNMGPIWGRQDPGGPHVGPMNFAIWVYSHRSYMTEEVFLVDTKWHYMASFGQHWSR